MTRIFSFLLRMFLAFFSIFGAIITSTNCFSIIVRAVFSSSDVLKAITPPNAEVGSVEYARL